VFLFIRRNTARAGFTFSNYLFSGCQAPKTIFSRYNAVYARRFFQPYPVRTTVGSDLGHTLGMLIEIDCVAYAAKKSSKRPSRNSKKKSARRRQ